MVKKLKPMCRIIKNNIAKGRKGVLSLHMSVHVPPTNKPHTRQSGRSSKQYVFWAT